MEPEKKGGFTVTDRRGFTQSGEAREVAGGPEPPGDAAAPPEAGPLGTGAALPEVDFHTFVLSLGSSTLLHLGELDHPETGKPQKDLALAKHTIEILTMLREKTKGNLTQPEEKLIDSLLYDLRLRFVAASK